jgi:DNA-binding MarR family transcriptional regulator
MPSPHPHPPLPEGLPDSRVTRAANRLHSVAIHLLRRARVVDRESGLGAERLSVLSVLAFVGPMTVSKLAQVEMVSRPAMSRTLKALAALGLVRHVRGDPDGRQVVVNATSAGRRLMQRGRRRRLEVIAAELATLAPADLTAIERAAAALETLGR